MAETFFGSFYAGLRHDLRDQWCAEDLRDNVFFAVVASTVASAIVLLKWAILLPIGAVAYLAKWMRRKAP